jgi:starvation-inducible outer membrane lipoprotein
MHVTNQRYCDDYNYKHQCKQVDGFTKWRLNRQYAKYTRTALNAGVEYYHLSVKSIGQQLETIINPCIEAGTIVPLIDRYSMTVI